MRKRGSKLILLGSPENGLVIKVRGGSRTPTEVGSKIPITEERVVKVLGDGASLIGQTVYLKERVKPNFKFGGASIPTYDYSFQEVFIYNKFIRSEYLTTEVSTVF